MFATNALTRISSDVHLVATQQLSTRSRYRADDFEECVYLASACNTIGKAKFSDRWTGRELSTQTFVDLPQDFTSASTWLSDQQHARAKILAQILWPDKAHVQPEGRGNALLNRIELWCWTENEWHEIYSTNERIRAVVKASSLRESDVFRCVRDEGEQRRLEFWLRARQGGEWIKGRLLPEHWRTERYRHRISYSEFNPDKPFHFAIDDPGNHLIYVTRASLQLVLARLHASSANEQTPRSMGFGMLPGLLPKLAFIATTLPKVDRPRTVESLAVELQAHPEAPRNLSRSRAKCWAREVLGSGYP